MNEQVDVNEDQESVGNSKDKQTLSYIQYVIQTIQKPDAILDPEEKGLHLYGMINLGLLFFFIFFSNFIYRIKLFTNTSWFDVGFSSSFTIGFAYAIPLGATLLLMNWYANNNDNRPKKNIAYFTEKLGAAMTIPIVLLITSIPITLLFINIGTWFRSLGITFMYIAIFMICYLFVSNKNMKIAAIFFGGFYLAYRMINYIL